MSADCLRASSMSKSMGELGARAANDQRAASTPTSASSSSRVMNSPSPLAHRDLLAVAHEADPGDEEHLDRVHVEAHRLGRVPDARHGAVVVGAPDVDELAVAAAELLGHVADVGREVGRLAGRAIDDPVLVIPEVGGAEPGRAVLLEHVAAGPQPLHGPLDPAVGVQRRLARPDIEVDAEVRQAGLDAGTGSAPTPMPRRPRRGRHPAALAVAQMASGSSAARVSTYAPRYASSGSSSPDARVRRRTRPGRGPGGPESLK